MAHPISSEKQHIQEIFKIRSCCDPNSNDLANYIEMNIYESFNGEQKYLFEMLQNADDEGAKENRSITVKFRLLSDQKDPYLIISHNARHFDKIDVEKITSIAQQRYKEKAESKEVTGYKGIGFKAIFSISDWVAIFSKGYQFRFDKNFLHPQQENSYRYPWMLAPIWTEFSDLSPAIASKLNLQEVNFIIKLDPKKVPDILKDLEAIAKKPEIMLFLRRIQQIQIIHGIAQNIFSIIPQGGNRYYVYEGNELKSCWLKHSIDLRIGKELKQILEEGVKVCPPRLKTALTTSLTFAARINANGEINSHAIGGLYSYLPTQVYLGGLPFNVNGDFLLDPSRTRLQDNEWNKSLLKSFAKCQFEWFASLNKDEKTRYQILKLFKQPSFIANETFTKVFHEGFNAGKEVISFLPSFANPTHLLKIREAVFDETGFYKDVRTVFPPKGLLDYKLEGHQNLHLENIITPYKLCQGLHEIIGKHNTFQMQKELFNFFAPKTANYPWSDLLPGTPILLSNTFEYIKPKETYFPILGDVVPPIEIPLSYIHPVLGRAPVFSSWAIQLGARNATDIEIFRGSVLPMLSSGISVKNCLPITGFIFQLYKKALLNKQDLFSLKSLPLLTMEGKLADPSTLFLSEIYQPFLRLGHNKATTVSELYAKQDPAVDLWKAFFEELGVQQEVTITLNRSRYLVKTGKLEKGKNFEKYLSFLKTSEITMGHPKDNHYIINLLDSNLLNCDPLPTAPQIWQLFWKKVVQNWDAIKNAPIGQYCAVNHQKKNVPVSYLNYMIQNNHCVPCVDGQLRMPKGVFFSKIISNPFSADLDPPLSKEQGEFFNFKTKLSFKETIMQLASFGKEKEMDAFSECLLELLLLNPSSKEVETVLAQYQVCLPAQDGKLYPIKKLYCFALSQGSPPMNTSHWLKEFPRISREQLIEICTLLKIVIVKDEDVVINYTGEPEQAGDLLPHLIERLPVLSRIEATHKQVKEDVLLWKMKEKLQRVNFVKVRQLFFSCNKILKDRLFAFHDKKNCTLYIHRDWKYPSTLQPFCELLSQLLELSKQTKKHLRDILLVEDLQEWMEEHNYTEDLLDTNSLPPPLLEDDSVEDLIEPLEKIEISSAKPPPVSSKNDSPLPKEKREVSKREKPETPSQEIYKEIGVNPNEFNFKNVKLSKAQLTPKNKEKFVPDDPSLEADPRKQLFPPHPKENPPEASVKTETITVTSPYSKDIGDWGEEFVYRKLKEDYKNKYPQSQMEDTDLGFKLTSKSLDLEVIWVNKKGETHSSYDLKVIKNKIERFIEVKSTLSFGKGEFKLGQKEYQVMQHYQDKYRFFRVYGAGSLEARIEKVKNPAACLAEGKIAINSLNIQL